MDIGLLISVIIVKIQGKVREIQMQQVRGKKAQFMVLIRIRAKVNLKEREKPTKEKLLNRFQRIMVWENKGWL